MKVFISWSGQTSQRLAKLLHEWLPTVIQVSEPWMSSENIDKGSRWATDLATQLQDTDFGIVCTTPDNVMAPWILFESGALSKSLNNSHVSSIIFGLEPSDLNNSPLLQFQTTSFRKDDLQKLILSINRAAPATESVKEEILIKSFERGWPELEQSVNEILLSSRSHITGPVSRSVSHTTSSATETAVQEILTLVRAQTKILSSPTEILPAQYLEEVILMASSPRTRGMNHPARRQLNRALNLLDIFRDLLDQKKVQFAPDVSQTLISGISSVSRDIQQSIDYLLGDGIRSRVGGRTSNRSEPGLTETETGYRLVKGEEEEGKG